MRTSPRLACLRVRRTLCAARIADLYALCTTVLRTMVNLGTALALTITL